MLTSFFNNFVIALSLSTATGIFVHDTRIDKAATAHVSNVIAAQDTAALAKHLAPDLHPHTERGSLSQAVTTLKSSAPSIKPRHDEDNKHLLPKHIVRGYHAFDGYIIPLE